MDSSVHDDDSVSRRRVLAALGAASTVGLAGCTGGGCEAASTVTLGLGDEAEVTVTDEGYEHPDSVDGCPVNDEKVLEMEYVQTEADPGDSTESGQRRLVVAESYNGDHTWFDFQDHRDDLPHASHPSVCVGFTITNWTEDEVQADLHLVTYDSDPDTEGMDRNQPGEWEPLSAEVCYSSPGFL